MIKVFLCLWLEKKKTYLEGKRRRTNCLFGNTFFFFKWKNDSKSYMKVTFTWDTKLLENYNKIIIIFYFLFSKLGHQIIFTISNFKIFENILKKYI